MNTIPGMYTHDGYQWSEPLSDALPPPPADGRPAPCQWGALTNSGPAADWPQDEYHVQVLQIGVLCTQPVTRYATHHCPGKRCPIAHTFYLVCHHHALYSYPIWGSDDPPGLHGVTSGMLTQATPAWRDWWQDHAARTAHAADNDDTRAIVLQPALF
ncbi:hypothetical protein [Nesterenkonia sandarakina]|uniref:Uncharacterized protein n=1 Tax=Nesterenkonia sandarakina TaxID=272918 RepID=A0A2T0YJF0_9MICC|nr:hypothetical protein [Nesterenkonia sandarakina]PRZ15169.1 hypothetical protein BCL67_10990 [Nesterenkonia sandarakina]